MCTCVCISDMCVYTHIHIFLKMGSYTPFSGLTKGFLIKKIPTVKICTTISRLSHIFFILITAENPLKKLSMVWHCLCHVPSVERIYRWIQFTEPAKCTFHILPIALAHLSVEQWATLEKVPRWHRSRQNQKEGGKPHPQSKSKGQNPEDFLTSKTGVKLIE